jgi:hypothetical protein
VLISRPLDGVSTRAAHPPVAAETDTSRLNSRSVPSLCGVSLEPSYGALVLPYS